MDQSVITETAEIVSKGPFLAHWRPLSQATRKDFPERRSTCARDLFEMPSGSKFLPFNPFNPEGLKMVAVWYLCLISFAFHILRLELEPRSRSAHALTLDRSGPCLRSVLPDENGSGSGTVTPNSSFRQR